MSNTSRLLMITGLIVLISLSLYGLLINSEISEYDAQIIAKRQENANWFSNDKNSPFVINGKPFHELNYFDPDKRYLIQATFIKASGNEPVTLITNTGENQVYYVYGSAVFDLQGKTCSLKLLYQRGRAQLFAPFIDKTSGETTYGAGRYLDLAIPEGETITIDFNLAYNPYCAYMDTYSCPFPPKSNILNVAINAGEKTYTK